MTKNKKGLIFNIQRFVLHDGPGIRTTIFFKGCSLSCLWCHNPESINPFPELLFRKDRCNACGDCMLSCPKEAIVLTNSNVKILNDKCNICGSCLPSCNTRALEIAGEFYTVEQVMDEILRDMAFYEQSNGGITISGGEPLMQLEFLHDLVQRAKNENLHVCLDTSGYSKWSNIKKILKYIDIFLYDVKTLNEERHLKLTGVSNKIILDNLNNLLKEGAQIIIRTPIILGYNFLNLEKEVHDHLINLIQSGFNDFELIPYHRFGEVKYEFLRRKYDLKVLPVDIDKLNILVESLKKEYSINVKISTPIIT